MVLLNYFSKKNFLLEKIILNLEIEHNFPAKNLLCYLIIINAGIIEKTKY